MWFRVGRTAAKLSFFAAIFLSAIICSGAKPAGTKKETIGSVSSIANLSDRLRTYGPDVCGGGSNALNPDLWPPLLLLVVVDTAAGDADKRREIRHAWHAWRTGTDADDDSGDVRMVFFAGKPKGRRAVQRLIDENRSVGCGGDVLWTNVAEEDELESLKAVAMLHLLRNECRRARFVLRVADRVIVNPAPLIRFARANSAARNTIWGYERLRFRPNENDPKSYCDWPAYLMTSDVVETLDRVLLLQPINYFQEQNVFITGTVAKIANIDVTYVDQFQGVVLSNTTAPANSDASDACHYLKNHFIFVTYFDVKEWSFLMNKYLKCLK